MTATVQVSNRTKAKDDKGLVASARVDDPYKYGNESFYGKKMSLPQNIHQKQTSEAYSNPLNNTTEGFRRKITLGVNRKISNRSESEHGNTAN